MPPELFQLDSVCPFFVPVLYIHMFTSSDDNILHHLALNGVCDILINRQKSNKFMSWYQ
jgi:hypothetical protein